MSPITTVCLLWWVLINEFRGVRMTESDSVLESEDGSMELKLPVSGLRISARRYGRGTGPTVLAVHGWLDNLNSFVPMAAELPGLELITIDMPGHGHSEHQARGRPYETVSWLGYLLEIMDVLGLGKTWLMGHSFGAGITSLFAGLYPERVKGLVAIENLGVMFAAEGQFPELLRHHHHMVQRSRYRRARQTFAGLEDAMFARRKGSSHPLSDASLRLIVERSLGPAEEGRLQWRTDPDLRIPPPWRLSQDHVYSLLEEITAPVLYIQATGGILTSPFVAAANEMAARVKDLNVLKVEGSHHVHMEAPQVIARPVLEFISGHEGQR